MLLKFNCVKSQGCQVSNLDLTHPKVKDILKPEVAEALDGLKGAGPAGAAEAPERPPTSTVRRRKRPMARPKPVDEIVATSQEVVNGRDVGNVDSSQNDS